MEKVFLGLGSNLGDSPRILEKVIKKIAEFKDIFELKPSLFYRSTPISEIAQNDFTNCVISFKISGSSPKELLTRLKELEVLFGKRPTLVKNAPRWIDIDLLLFGRYYLNEEDIQVPHPRMLQRLFVIKPLFDLVSSIDYPISSSEVEKIFLKPLLKKISKDPTQSVQELCFEPICKK